MNNKILSKLPQIHQKYIAQTAIKANNTNLILWRNFFETSFSFRNQTYQTAGRAQTGGTAHPGSRSCCPTIGQEPSSRGNTGKSSRSTRTPRSLVTRAPEVRAGAATTDRTGVPPLPRESERATAARLPNASPTVLDHFNLFFERVFHREK